MGSNLLQIKSCNILIYGEEGLLDTAKKVKQLFKDSDTVAAFWCFRTSLEPSEYLNCQFQEKKPVLWHLSEIAAKQDGRITRNENIRNVKVSL